MTWYIVQPAGSDVLVAVLDLSSLAVIMCVLLEKLTIFHSNNYNKYLLVSARSQGSPTWPHSEAPHAA